MSDRIGGNKNFVEQFKAGLDKAGYKGDTKKIKNEQVINVFQKADAADGNLDGKISSDTAKSLYKSLNINPEDAEEEFLAAFEAYEEQFKSQASSQRDNAANGRLSGRGQTDRGQVSGSVVSNQVQKYLNEAANAGLKGENAQAYVNMRLKTAQLDEKIEKEGIFTQRSASQSQRPEQEQIRLKNGEAIVNGQIVKLQENEAVVPDYENGGDKVITLSDEEMELAKSIGRGEDSLFSHKNEKTGRYEKHPLIQNMHPSRLSALQSKAGEYIIQRELEKYNSENNS